jgi:hypothetical protein
VIDDFGRFWNVYPRRVSVVSAREAWAVAITKTTAQALIDAAQAYASDPHRDPTFTPSPANWLSGERWLDGPMPPRKLSPEEALERDNRLSKERDELERKRSAEIAREFEEAKAKAVPMPPELKKQLLEQWAQTVYPKP